MQTAFCLIEGKLSYVHSASPEIVSTEFYADNVDCDIYTLQFELVHLLITFGSMLFLHVLTI